MDVYRYDPAPHHLVSPGDLIDGRAIEFHNEIDIDHVNVFHRGMIYHLVKYDRYDVP